MQATMKRKLAIGTTVLAAGALGGGAYAASSSGGNPRHLGKDFRALSPQAKQCAINQPDRLAVIRTERIDQFGIKPRDLLRIAKRIARFVQGSADGAGLSGDLDASDQAHRIFLFPASLRSCRPPRVRPSYGSPRLGMKSNKL